MICFKKVVPLVLVLLVCSFYSAEQSAPGMVVLDNPGFPYLFELDPGDSYLLVRTYNGRKVKKQIKLVSVKPLKESNYALPSSVPPNNFYQCKVELEIEGKPVEVYYRPYQMPVTLEGLRVYIENIREWDESALFEKCGDMSKAVRLSVCMENEPWGPQDIVFPINDYVWRSAVYNNTWSALVPFNTLYYHRGEDYGAIPDRLNVVAPVDGVITASPLPDGDGQSNAVYVMGDNGLRWRLSHMNTESIKPEYPVGTRVQAGTVLGKTGMTWAGKKSQKNDPHLHVAIDFNGTRLASFPYLMEAYMRKFPDPVFAIAGGYRFTVSGQPVELDAGRSFSRDGQPIKNFQWKLSNGKTVQQVKTKMVYDQPGIYAEELQVESSTGAQDRDFLYVKVFDPLGKQDYAAGWAYYYPLRGIKPGTEVLFWNRLNKTTTEVKINFGDNDAWYPIEKETIHRYDRAGRYVVSLTSAGPANEPVMLKMEAVVEDNITGHVRTGTMPEQVPNPVIEVSKWEMHEFSVTASYSGENPFTDAMLVGEFTSPSGRLKTIDGFYDGDKTWRLRFVPDEEGKWNYRLRGKGVEILQHGKINCKGVTGRGFIHIHPQNPFSFARDDRTPFFPMGATCYGLLDDSPITDELRVAYLEKRKLQHFNFVRMSTGHSYERAQIDPDYWAWGGTPQEPDLDRFNPVFFHKLDKLLLQMKAFGMNAELILLNFYRLPFIDPKQWTASRERLWLHYLLSRYSAFDNIFMWTISNEYETHPDGKYRLDMPEDVDWVKVTARYIKENDPYHHLVTVHPVISSSASGKSPRDPFEPPWQIGGFYGDGGALDVLSQQTGKSGKGVVWNDKLNCWEGDDSNLVASLQADLRYGKPVLNTENGYEYLKGYPTGRKQVHHTDKVRRTSWRIVCGGGYFAAGFRGSLGQSDIWNRIDPSNKYTFDLRDEGAALQLSYLYEFFTALPFWRMHPFEGVIGDAVALAERGKTYVVFLLHGGEITLDLAGSGKMEMKWFNPRTGQFGLPAMIKGGHKRKFRAPDKKDWALLLKATEK